MSMNKCKHNIRILLMTEWILNYGKPLHALRTNPTLGHRPHPPIPFNNITHFYLLIFMFTYLEGNKNLKYLKA